MAELEEIAAQLEQLKQQQSAIIQKIANDTGQVISSAVNQMQGKLSDFVSDAEVEFKSLSDRVGDMFSGDKFLGSQVMSEIRSTISGIQRIFSEANLVASFNTAEMVRNFSGVFGILKEEAMRPENIVSLGMVAGTDATKAALTELLSPIDSIERRVVEINRASNELFMGFQTGATDASYNALELQENMDAFRVAAVQAGMQTTQGFQASLRALQALRQAGLDPEEIVNMGDLTAQLNDGIQNFEALSAVQRIAAATGLEVSEVGKTMFQSMRTLGVEGEDAIQMFGTLKGALEGTALDFRIGADAIMQGADRLKFFGNNVESAGAIYQNFIRTLGEGREALAAPLFQEVIGGLAQMNEGMRAFIGLTGQTGGFGAGGAIGGMLRVEQALETGNLEGIMGDLQQQIERLSGAPIMTREQAIDRGQEQQFLTQRRIMQQALGIGDVGQASRIMEMMAGGQQVGAEDIRGRGGREFAGMMDEGQEAINRATTTTERMANTIDTVGVSALNNLTDMVEQFGTVTADVIPRTAEQFTDFINRLSVSPDEARAGILGAGTQPGGEEVPEPKQPGGLETLGGVPGGMENLSTVGRSVAGGLENISTAVGTAVGGISNLGNAAQQASEGLEALGGGRQVGVEGAAFRMNMNPPRRLNVDNAIRLAGGAASAAGAVAGGEITRRVNLQFDDQEMTLRLALDFDADTLSLKPLVEQMRNEIQAKIRQNAVEETDGTFA